MEVVYEWDKEVRSICGNEGLWFAQVSPETGEIIKGSITAGKHRASIATRDLKNWLKKVCLPYHSPHKFRHGNAVYSLKLGRDLSALKAISQNLMHSNISITDGVYGILLDNDVREQISNLGRKINYDGTQENNDLLFLMEQLLRRLSIISSFDQN